MRWPFFSFLLVLLLATGCASVGVQSDYARDANLSKYKTYAWMPAPDSVTNTNLALRASLMKEIDEEMSQRGYTRDTANPDVVLVLHTMMETETEVIETPIYSTYRYYRPGLYSGFYYDPYYGYYWPGYVSVPEVIGYDIETVRYKEGSVVVDMIETKNNHIVWRGWTDEALKSKLEDDADDLMDKLFERKFPVKAKSN